MPVSTVNFAFYEGHSFNYLGEIERGRNEADSLFSKPDNDTSFETLSVNEPKTLIIEKCIKIKLRKKEK